VQAKREEVCLQEGRERAHQHPLLAADAHQLPEGRGARPLQRPPDALQAGGA